MATFRLGSAGQKRFSNSIYSKNSPRSVMERGQTTLNKYVKALLHRDLDKRKRRLIDELRKKANLSQEQLAEKVGVYK